MSIITLLTDFGTADEYVGLMKGAILSINPSAVIVDITHNIDPQDITAAAYILRSSYGYFPPGTVHAAVVDPGVGSRRKVLALNADKHFFCAPDNGILSLLIRGAGSLKAVSVSNPVYFRRKISHTFHGRDIFSPVAAHLSLGEPMSEFGDEMEIEDLCLKGIPKPVITSENWIEGRVVNIDRYGNLMTNIDTEILFQWRQLMEGRKPVIHIANQTIGGLVTCYADARPGIIMALIGSRDLLEISVNMGNAQKMIGVNKGEPIVIKAE